MGNKIFSPMSEKEVPLRYFEENPHLPKIGDIIDVSPCFQCSIMSAANVAGPCVKAEIISVKFGVYVPKDQQDISNQKFKDSDYKCIIFGKLLSATSITPYCGHAHGVLNAPEGLKTRLHYNTEFESVGTNADGWLFKNKVN